MNFLIYYAKIREFKKAFVSIIRKMSTDVPLVGCSSILAFGEICIISR
ncbi:unnamed protein product [Porites evermanni]|uniref:Uncharacterized protein n=1 Tax=Porites evermanni TaxID=104178 RepID=A0ABN8N9G2_9CNID|nr:unnamed protein product [Porites evermanni]